MTRVTPPAGIPPIELAIETVVDPADAWASITQPERIALWFTQASSLGPVGSPYRLDFGEGEAVVGEVLELEPGRRFAHSWSWEGSDPEETTTVTWSVDPLPGGGSRILLRHTGWAEGGEQARNDHEGYWIGYLDDLRSILEEA